MGAPGFRIDFSQDSPHTIIDTERLTADQFSTGQQALRVVTQVNNDVVAGHFLDSACQQFALATSILIRDLGALSVSDALNDDLLGGLCRDPAKVDILDHFFVIVAWLQCGIHLSGLFGSKLCA